ncbi:hypothetical protein TNCV_4934731 [Trichonephila clavipes]|nr:hypothetical protein TNCV_4934731 [Trichonephila clavipes]
MGYGCIFLVSDDRLNAGSNVLTSESISAGDDLINLIWRNFGDYTKPKNATRFDSIEPHNSRSVSINYAYIVDDILMEQLSTFSSESRPVLSVLAESSSR